MRISDWSADVCSSDLALTRDDLACIIYTSGTGGAPRGVMQHHGGILHNVAGCFAIIANDFPDGTETFLSFLPLIHAYAPSGGQFLPIGLGGQTLFPKGRARVASTPERERPARSSAWRGCLGGVVAARAREPQRKRGGG